MGRIEELVAQDPVLASEVSALSEEHRRWLEVDLALRARAATLAIELSLDEGDIYHQLKQLRRTSTERLRTGLAHGRRRLRAAQ